MLILQCILTYEPQLSESSIIPCWDGYIIQVTCMINFPISAQARSRLSSMFGAV